MGTKPKKQRRKVETGKNDTVELNQPTVVSDVETPSEGKATSTMAAEARGTKDGLHGACQAEPSLDGEKIHIQRGVTDGIEEGGVIASKVVDGLVVAIEEHDSFFSRMLDMIPEKLVLPTKEVPEASYASKYMKNKRGEAPQQSKKEQSKKNKRARYAADNQKTVLERQQERARVEEKEAADGQEDGDAMSEGGGEGGEEGNDETVLRPEALHKKSMTVGSMDALRKRIAERIRESQEKRTAAAGSRRAMTVERRNKEKEGKRERKRQGSKTKKSKGREKHAGEDAKDGASAKQEQVQEKVQKETPSKFTASGEKTKKLELELPPLPAVEDVGDIEFSGLRGVAGQSTKSRNLPPKVGAPGSKMRRLHGLLASAEEKRKRLEGLRQSEDGKEQARQEVWGDAIRVAGGKDLKDNPAALKKIIKRREKEKAKSTTQWKDRVAGVKKEQSARQTKREDNLNKRKMKGTAAEAADDTEGSGGKRQRRAGFEGKKQDFINKEKPRSSTGDGSGRRGRGGGVAGRPRGGGNG